MVMFVTANRLHFCLHANVQQAGELPEIQQLPTKAVITAESPYTTVLSRINVTDIAQVNYLTCAVTKKRFNITFEVNEYSC